MNAEFWNSRYGEETLAYGYEANAYLRDALSRYLPDTAQAPLRVLCLAEGQGRNALHIAKAFPHSRVVAVDYSQVGVDTTNALADKEHVADRLHAYVADLASYELGSHCPDVQGEQQKNNKETDETERGRYDLVISIFAHTPSAIRKKVHEELAGCLSRRGLLILQAYTPANIGRGTGGPQSVDFCMTKEGLMAEIQGMTVMECEEKETVVVEGNYHQGFASVVQGVWMNCK